MQLDAFTDDRLMEALEGIDDTIKRHNVRFVRLQFSDIVGIVKQVTIPIELWDRAIENGVWFDGSSIEGFARIAESDMYLVPDLDTFMPIPWEMELSTARVVCDVFTPNGDPFSGDPRFILRRQLNRAKELGFDFLVGPELEFFLFRRHPDNSLYPLTPHDEAGYFDVSSDSAHGVRRQMVDALNALGIKVEASHHEVASGQNEIDFQYGPALAAADNTITLRTTLKAIAQKNGLHCTFMPKPITGVNGSGMHVHQSLWKHGEDATCMYDESDEYGLSKTALHFIAGQLAHAAAITPIIAPLVNSYKRLVPGYEAPVYISWGRTNRSALIRIPRINPNRPQSTRCELRCPDPSANPYLAFAVMLAAGLDGIERKLDPPMPAEEDLYQMNGDRSGLETLPGNLGEALDALRQDEVVQDALGQHVFERYVEAKNQEWDSYRNFVSQWELDRYLGVY
ncbi:MAG: type I glutamate--ammonia ligase [Caldilineaceae bacterium]|nr:type I glutamate--ammonia ligase [Caldilineaceae bacterium]MCY3991363.1 type I glutamate--ammonia ligase [Caldilineaceae bacterium]MCY4091663.1 type I glutamate--ammonia ligase [Caldilineaceae bacterium]MDE0072300.1 type I glutamate--ammonia ligase [Caldilineaceae bacterium]MDE0182694.1 type I glutamate--ammonia ligase [Caldilineaceae bacterium]